MVGNLDEKSFARWAILIVRESLPDDELYGFTPDAGLPKGYGPGGWGIGKQFST